MNNTEKKKGCNCLQESEQKIFDHMKEELEQKGKLHSADKSKSHYANTVFTFDADLSRKPYMSYEFSYTPKKKDGSAGTPKIIKQTIVTAFCPFCGEKYPAPEEMLPIES